MHSSGQTPGGRHTGMPVRVGLRNFWSTWKCFQQPFAGRTHGVLKRNLGIKSISANWCVLRECAQEPLQFYWFRSAIKFWNRMVDSNSNTLRYVMKADISLGNSGASNCWTRQMKDAFGDLQNGTVYRSDLLQCRKLNISILRIDLRFRHQAVRREAHGQDPRSCLKSLWLITTGLLCLRDQLIHVHHLSCRSIWRWLWAKVSWGT